MGQILKFPVQASKFGYRRVRKRGRTNEHPDQLVLFPAPAAQILNFTSALSPFEQALLGDEQSAPNVAELYRKAIEEQDSVDDAHCNLGIIESKRGNISAAFDCFTTALKCNPRHLEAHYNLGNLYFDVNELRLAQIHYEMAVEIDPLFPNVYFNLALARAINNDLAAAAAALTRYQELVPMDEGRQVHELLENLKKNLLGAKNSRSST